MNDRPTEETDNPQPLQKLREFVQTQDGTRDDMEHRNPGIVARAAEVVDTVDQAKGDKEFEEARKALQALQDRKNDFEMER